MANWAVGELDQRLKSNIQKKENHKWRKKNKTKTSQDLNGILRRTRASKDRNTRKRRGRRRRRRRRTRMNRLKRKKTRASALRREKGRKK